MKKNEEYTVSCESITDLGFGVSHIDGMTVFISNLLPGEKARIRILKVFKTYAIARTEQRFNDSAQRTEPKCPYFGRCGGCSLQHIRYEDQLKNKHAELEHLFHQVSDQIDVLPVLGMEDPYYYRNKAQFPLQVKDGKLEAGFYKPRSNEIVDEDFCMIQSEKINEIYQWIKKELPVKSAAFLRHLFIRVSKKTGEAQVVFIGSRNMHLEAFAKRLSKVFPDIASVVFNQNDGSSNVILGEDYQILYGSDSITEDCLGLKIHLHFKSFFQVNPDQMEVLYQKALEMADLNPGDRVVELYSGTGTIGLLASRKAGSVIGVEIVPEAVRNARENAKLNSIENAEFICQDASAFAAEFSRSGQHCDVVMVDPPRKGMEQQGILDILTLQPRKVVYISCNPRTLARDLKVFMEYGYDCKVIQPVDMFAQTSGVECAALIEQRVKKDS